MSEKDRLKPLSKGILRITPLNENQNKNIQTNSKNKKLRFDYWTADMKCNEHRHAQEVMKELGYKVISAEPFPIGDCWIFEVEELIEPLQPYLTEIKD